MQEGQLRLFGLPIRPAFSQRYPRKQQLRRNLGMDLHKPAILLVGGGEGMGPVEKTVDALASVIGADCQVVVVCGRNAKLVEKLKAKCVNFVVLSEGALLWILMRVIKFT